MHSLGHLIECGHGLDQINPNKLAPCLICGCEKQKCRDGRRQAQIWFTEKREQHNAIRQLWMNDKSKEGRKSRKRGGERKGRVEVRGTVEWEGQGSGARERLKSLLLLMIIITQNHPKNRTSVIILVFKHRENQFLNRIRTQNRTLSESKPNDTWYEPQTGSEISSNYTL